MRARRAAWLVAVMTTAACNAIVGFPDRHLDGDADDGGADSGPREGDSGPPPNDATAAQDGGDGGDAAPSGQDATAGEDAASRFCASYPDAELCEDFEDAASEAFTYKVQQRDGSPAASVGVVEEDGGNHELEIAIPAGGASYEQIYAFHPFPPPTPARHLSFVTSVSAGSSERVYLFQLVQDDHGLVVSLSGGGGSLEADDYSSLSDASLNVLTLEDSNFTLDENPHEVHATLTPVDGGPWTVSLSIDGTSLLDASTLAAPWTTTDGVELILGESNTLGSTTKVLEYDNVLSTAP